MATDTRTGEDACGPPFVPMLILGGILFWRSPNLQAKRLNAKGKSQIAGTPPQNEEVSLYMLMHVTKHRMISYNLIRDKIVAYTSFSALFRHLIQRYEIALPYFKSLFYNLFRDKQSQQSTNGFVKNHKASKKKALTPVSLAEMRACLLDSTPETKKDASP